MPTDNFNRADETPLGGNWSTSPGFSALRLLSNTCAGPSSAADAAAYWNAASFANDQYSQVVASTLGTNTDWGPAARCATGGGTKNCYVANTYVTDEQLFKFVGGSYSLITSVTTSDVIVGDTIRVEAQGTTIRWVKNGTTQGSATDSSLASGAAGIFFYEANPRLDNWEGGDLGGGGVSGTIAQTLSDFTSAIIGTHTRVGTIGVTTQNHSSAMSGTPTILGTIAQTLSDFTGAITGTKTVVGTISVTMEALTSAISGTRTAVGTIVVTMANAIGAFSGSVGEGSGTHHVLRLVGRCFLWAERKLRTATRRNANNS